LIKPEGSKILKKGEKKEKEEKKEKKTITTTATGNKIISID
jgi:hypothetical protein